MIHFNDSTSLALRHINNGIDHPHQFRGQRIMQRNSHLKIDADWLSLKSFKTEKWQNLNKINLKSQIETNFFCFLEL